MEVKPNEPGFLFSIDLPIKILVFSSAFEIRPCTQTLELWKNQLLIKRYMQRNRNLIF